MVMEFADAETEHLSYLMWLAANFRAIGVQEVRMAFSWMQNLPLMTLSIIPCPSAGMRVLSSPREIAFGDSKAEREEKKFGWSQRVEGKVPVS